MLYYFKKGKNTIEMWKKICAAYGEGTMIEHVQSGLWSFMVDISHWTVLQSVDTDSDQIEQSALYHVGDSQHTQIIQIKHWESFAPAWLCLSVVMLMVFT